MTEQREASFGTKDHPEMRKYIFWGPITEPARREFVFYTGRRLSCTFSESQMAEIQSKQSHTPVLLLETEKACWWMYQDRIYRHSEPLGDPVAAKGFILQHHRSKEARLQRARRLAEEADS